MDARDVVEGAVLVLVAIISFVSAWASQRAANKASTTNVQTETRVDMEREAYVRARKFDMDTITRQDGELKELRKRVSDLEQNEEKLEHEIESLKEELELRPKGPLA